MSASSLVTLYRSSLTALDRNLAGLSEEEALFSPQPAGNSVNWLVGHLLATRSSVHKLLGLGPAWPADLGPSETYHRGATGFSPADAVPLAGLRRGLDASQEQILAALGRATPTMLGEPATDTATVGDRLAFLGFHEGYHVGQIGLLRRLLGKPGAIP